MKRSLIWSSIVPVALAAALALGGCAKKQVRQEGQVGGTGQTPSSSSSTVEARPAPVYTSPVRETPMETPARVTELAPALTAAAEPAPRQPVAGAGLSRETSSGLERIQFEFDQSTVSPAAKEILARNYQYLLANPGVRVRVEGHCDERGTTEYNLALGERRAKAALQYLMDLGVDPNRMTAVSYGEEVPLDPGHSEEAWARNRRAEFVEISK